MKRTLFLILLISSNIYSQDISVKTDSDINITRDNSEKNIRVPMPDDMSKYTHIAIIDIDPGIYKQAEYRRTQKALMSSTKIIVNPFEYDKSKARKDHSFLKTIKNETWLYLYFDNGWTDYGIILRDYNGNVIYAANYKNYSTERSEALFDIAIL